LNRVCLWRTTFARKPKNKAFEMVKRAGDKEVSVHKIGNFYGVYIPVEWAKALKVRPHCRRWRRRGKLLMRLRRGALLVGRESSGRGAL
jgi:hypothetical protein